MLFENINVLKADGTYLPAQYVGIRDARIAWVSPEHPQEDFGERVNGAGRLLIPGLYNAHTHVAMTLMRGYGEELPLQSWLFDRIFPFEDKLYAEAVYWGSLLGMAEMLSTGTVSFTDMYYFCEETAKAALECGIKANIGRGISCFDETKKFHQLPAYTDLKELISAYHGAGDGQLRIDVAPHAEYTTRPDILRDAADMAGDYGLRMQIHVSETQKEHLECVGRHGVTPTALLETTGVLEHPLTLAHGVWLTDADMDRLAKHGVTVAHCAKSNLKLGSGIAQAEKLIRRGVLLAIGTDSAASNNTLDMLDEMRVAGLIAKGVACDPAALSASTLLRCGTRGGALSQGREDCGDVAVGYRADVVMLDTTDLGFCPSHAPLSNLLYGAGSRAVCMTVVNGRVLYRNGSYTTLDIERVRYQVQRCTECILKA